MTLKDSAAPWTISEQIVEDLPTGLTFQFEVVPDDADAPYHLRIFGDNLPFGNREILFGSDGRTCASGTATAGLCKPTWLTELEK